MTDSSTPDHKVASAPGAGNVANKDAGMRSEVSARWGKFTAAEISALKDKDDLIIQVQSKYNIDKAQAQKDVEAIAKGRSL